MYFRYQATLDDNCVYGSPSRRKCTIGINEKNCDLGCISLNVGIETQEQLIKPFIHALAPIRIISLEKSDFNKM